MRKSIGLLVIGTAVWAQDGSISAQLIREHTRYLSTDQMEGRGVGDRGGKLATDYIAAQLALAGAKAAGDNGTFFQKFRLVGKDTKNVLGLIEGTDPELKNEIVVLGAHYDHVGMADQRDFGRMPGRGDDTIWNGAITQQPGGALPEVSRHRRSGSRSHRHRA